MCAEHVLTRINTCVCTVTQVWLERPNALTFSLALLQRKPVDSNRCRPPLVPSSLALHYISYSDYLLSRGTLVIYHNRRAPYVYLIEAGAPVGTPNSTGYQPYLQHRSAAYTRHTVRRTTSTGYPRRRNGEPYGFQRAFF